MKIFRYPDKTSWNQILARPVFDTTSELETVKSILADVRKDGDTAIRRYTVCAVVSPLTNCRLVKQSLLGQNKIFQTNSRTLFWLPKQI